MRKSYLKNIYLIIDFITVYKSKISNVLSLKEKQEKNMNMIYEYDIWHTNHSFSVQKGESHTCMHIEYIVIVCIWKYLIIL